jgi:hypothetical protein
VAPLLVLWIVYLTIKGFAQVHVSGTPKDTSDLGGFGAAVTLVIGFATWGQEPDFFRYAKAKLSWPVIIYCGAFVAFMLCIVGGWMVGQIATSSDFGPALRTITHFSLFGLTTVAFIFILISQVAINDGNYYVVINAGQNVLGGLKRWNRLYTCAIAAAGCGLFAWLVPYVISNGFYRVAALSAVAIPTATVIMYLDHFVVPWMFGVRRSLERVPRWRDAAVVNWPALTALVIAAGFGGWASGVYPGQSLTDVKGIPPLETWVLGAALYLILVAVARALAPSEADLHRSLGFSKPALQAAVAGEERQLPGRP